MHVHQKSGGKCRCSSCTYPLFRMHVHQEINMLYEAKVVLTHYSECMFIVILYSHLTKLLYLPTIQNACSSVETGEKEMVQLYLPTIQNACSSAIEIKVLYNKLYLPTIQNACSSLDKYYSA